MRYHRILAGITTAVLSLIAVGCAGPAAETGAGLADAAASSSSATALCGTWKGSYWYVAGDHTSMSGSALTLQIGGDSTFTLKWGNRPPSAGTVAIQGNRHPPRRVRIAGRPRSFRREALRRDEG
jgi:hypothetical protein